MNQGGIKGLKLSFEGVSLLSRPGLGLGTALGWWRNRSENNLSR